MSTNVAVREDERTEVAAPVSDAASLLSVITSAASNPSVDVDKLERMMAMYERVQARQAEVEFKAAFARMQTDLPIIEKRGKADRGKWSYAKWDDAVELIRPVLQKHGFSLCFKTKWENERLTVTAILMHEAGHQESADSPPLVADNSGSKNSVQSLGSTTSYGKRYAAFAVLNIVARDEDDDGEAGDTSGTISDEQRDAIIAKAHEVGADLEKFLTYLAKRVGRPLDSFADLPANHFNAAMAALEAKRKRKPA